MSRFNDKIPGKIDSNFDPDGDNNPFEGFTLSRESHVLNEDNDPERKKTGYEFPDYGPDWKKINDQNYWKNVSFYVLLFLTALSTILTIMLICCYEFPNSWRSNLRDFSIAMICITVIFFVISLVLLRYFGVGENSSTDRIKTANFFTLSTGDKVNLVTFFIFLQVICILCSVLVYLNKLNDF